MPAKSPKERRQVFSSVPLPRGSSSYASAAVLSNGKQLLRYPSYHGSEAKVPTNGIAIDSSNTSAELDALWMAGFLDHDRSTQDEKSKAELRSLLSLPGSDVLSHDILNILRPQGRSPTTATKGHANSTLSAEEKEQLDAASRKLLMKRKQLRCAHPLAITASNKSKSSTPALAPYHAANTKITKALRMTTASAPSPPEMHSDLLDYLFQINRRETIAAVAIQSIWRRRLSIDRMQNVLLDNRSAKRIQAIIRGHLVRLRVRRIRQRLLRAALRCQRQYRCRKAWRRWRCNQQVERRAAAKCQSIARVWFARRIAKEMRRQDAATKIQAVWKGYQGRRLRVHLWLFKNATIIQCCRRKQLAKNIVAQIHQSKAAAATHIERWWRGHSARMRRDEILYRRTVESRSNQVRVLSSEEQFWSDHLAELEKRVASDESVAQWQKTLAELPTKATALERQIQTDEILLIEQRALRQNLTPRSVEQGWLEQVERNIINTRESITNSKLELVFGVRRTIRQAETDLQQRTDEVSSAREARDRYAKWKDEELEELWDCQRQHDKAELAKSKLQAIANERRRWAVAFTVPSGKPEKDEGVLAEQRKRRVEQSPGTFCGGTVDLLANRRTADIEGQSQEQYRILQDLVERIKLRSHENEALQFDTLLDPILKKMRDGPAEAIAKSGTLSTSAARRAGLHDTARGMNNANENDVEVAETTKSHTTSRRISTPQPKLPRSMPFAVLGRIRAEREAFERRAAAIRNDAHCRRWMQDEDCGEDCIQCST